MSAFQSSTRSTVPYHSSLSPIVAAACKRRRRRWQPPARLSVGTAGSGCRLLQACTGQVAQLQLRHLPLPPVASRLCSGLQHDTTVPARRLLMHFPPSQPLPGACRKVLCPPTTSATRPCGPGHSNCIGNRRSSRFTPPASWRPPHKSVTHITSTQPRRQTIVAEAGRCCRRGQPQATMQGRPQHPPLPVILTCPLQGPGAAIPAHSALPRPELTVEHASPQRRLGCPPRGRYSRELTRRQSRTLRRRRQLPRCRCHPPLRG